MQTNDPIDENQPVTAPGGSATYYALLFLPPALRRVALALHAFNREVNRVADTCQDPGVALAKLAWWQDEVGRLFASSSTPNSNLTPTHPITRTLAEHLHSHLLPGGIRIEHLLAMIEAGLMNVNQSRYLDWPALRRYGEQAAGVLGQCIARMVCVTAGEKADPALLAAAEKLALAVQLTHLIRNVGQDARRGRIYLPVNELQQFGVKAAEILNGENPAAASPLPAPTSPPFAALMQFQAQRARQLAQEAVQALKTHTATRRALRPNLALAVLAHALLAEIERDGWQVLAQRTSLTPLRKFWLAWRVWSSGGRYAIKKLR